MNQDQNINNQTPNTTESGQPTSSTSSAPTATPRRRYTSAKRDFSQLPHRQNGAQRPAVPVEDKSDKNDTPQPVRKKSRKSTGVSKGKIILWTALILAIIAGIAIITIFAMGNKHTSTTFRDGDREYSVSYFGTYEENGNIKEGTLKFSDNSSAEIKASDNGMYIVSYSNGSTYEGEFEDMHRNGQGTYTMANGDKYVGEFHYDSMWGEGSYEYANGDKYEGSFENNMKSGKGTYTFKNGDVYVGEFSNDMRNGKGIYTYADGSVYEGNYVNNKRNDENAMMTIKYSNGTQDRYIGAFVDDCREGKGVYTWSNGDSYVGEFHANNMDGVGTYTWASGRTYTGLFKMGSIVKDATAYPKV